MRLAVTVIRRKREIWVFEGKAYVGEDIVAEAKIMAALKEEG
jgi:3-hydroxymyristoyl/3-hydroxydecanoyl-(acyl carrier protein) dehydratase